MRDKNTHRKSADDKIVYFPKRNAQSAAGKPKFHVNKLSKSGEPFFNFGHIPLFTKAMFWALLAIHTISFFALDAGYKFSLFYNFGFVPDAFTGFETFSPLLIITPITSLFLHGSWAHLGFNLVMMITMGLYFERLFGLWQTAALFAVCGLAGNLCYLILSPDSAIPVIGASGAINGLFAFTFLHMLSSGKMGPEMVQRGPLPFLLLWLSMILIGGVISNDVSWQSHLGGFLSGVGIFNLWKKGYIRT